MAEDYGPLTVIRASELSDATNQSDGAVRLSGVDDQLTAATAIWMGRVTTQPGERSAPHHHGEAQTAGFVLKGEARLWFGEGYEQTVDLDEGDFVFVPPFFEHIEGNRSQEKELVWLTARTPGNIVVNLDG